MAANNNSGVIATGAGPTIDARSLHLPAQMVRPPNEVVASPGLNNLPAPRNGVFVGRDEDLARLDAAMDNGSGRAVVRVVHGLGGVGKSTLALEYAHRFRHRYNPIWWIAADTAEGIVAELAELAVRLDPIAAIGA
ncbi:AAA family ATPase, partial [Streptomyces beijiangensis]